MEAGCDCTGEAAAARLFFDRDSSFNPTGDTVLNDVETTHGCDPNGMAPGGGSNYLKYDMVMGRALPTCPGMPLWCGADAILNRMSDLEMDAFDISWKSWKIGSAKDEDWAAPGKQWPEGN